MAITTFTGDLSAFFAAGTSLEARPASNWPAIQRPPAAGTAPVGAATATATSNSSGVVSLTGLADSTEYYVSDATGTRYVRITTFPPSNEVMTDDIFDSDGTIKYAVRSEWPPNPLSEGGIGNGDLANAAVDTAAIKACIAKGGVTLPARHHWMINDRLSVIGINDFVIRGDGPSSQMELVAGTNKNLLRINDQGNPAITVDRVLLKDFRVDHNGRGQANQGGGIEGCLVGWNCKKVIIENVEVDEPRSTGFDFRACQTVRAKNPIVEDLIHSGLGGNAINFGATSSLTGVDYVVEGAEVSGGGDVAIWLSGVGAKRLSAVSNIVRGDTQRVVTDAEVVGGSLNVVHSESADFTANDVGKFVYLITAAGVRTGPFLIIAIVDEAHATLSSNAAAMSGATAAIGAQSSGVICEGGPSVDTSNISQIDNKIESIWNVGLGVSDAGQTALAHHEAIVALNQVTNAQRGSTAAWITGRNLKFNENLIYLFQGQGLLIGQSGDWDCAGMEAVVNTIEAAATATGSGIRANQTGSFTNYVRDLLLAFNRVVGNGGGTYGVELLGRLKDIDAQTNRIEGWANSGLRVDVNGASSPKRVRIRGGYSKNNNRAGAGVSSVATAGYAINAGDDIHLTDATGIDEQGSPTQRNGVWSRNATNVKIKRNDFSVGNVAAAKDIGFVDNNSVDEDNLTAVGAYEGVATLVAGTVVVSTAAVANASRIELTHRTFSNPGALFVSARTSGTSFTITSTNGADASQINWRLR